MDKPRAVLRDESKLICVGGIIEVEVAPNINSALRRVTGALQRQVAAGGRAAEQSITGEVDRAGNNRPAPHRKRATGRETAVAAGGEVDGGPVVGVGKDTLPRRWRWHRDRGVVAQHFDVVRAGRGQGILVARLEHLAALLSTRRFSTSRRVG